MRDAYGGTFMIYLFVIFIAIYIIFVGVAFNYARAFKVKDKVMDIIEQNEGFDLEDESVDSTKGQIEAYLKSVSYRVTNINDKDDCPTATYSYIDERGYCIGIVEEDATGTIYAVKTFVKIEFPFLDLGFIIPVKGETRKIERINS